MSEPLYLQGGMTEQQCHGAAIILSFLMDLFTISGKEAFSRTDIVVVIDMIGQRELPPGLLDKVKEYASEDNNS